MGKSIRDYEVTEIRFTKVDNAVNGMAWNKYGQVIAKATAKCHPEDKFDFSYGEALCNTRLIQEIARVKREHKRPKYIMFCPIPYEVPSLCEVHTDSKGNDYVISDGRNYYLDCAPFKDCFCKPCPKDFLINGAYGIRHNARDNSDRLFVVVNNFEIYENGGFDEVSDEYSDLRADEDLEEWFITKIAFLKDGAGGFNCARRVFNGASSHGTVVWERE